MSQAIMAEVAAQSQARGSARSVLLEIAFYARDDGTHAFPSMQTLAERLGRSIQHIATMIGRLEQQGHLLVFRDKSRGKRPRNFYQIVRPWTTAQTIMQQSKKSDAQTIMQYFCMDLKPKTSERKTHVRTPEDEETQHAIRDEIRNQETFLQTIGNPGSIAYVQAEARVIYLQGL